MPTRSLVNGFLRSSVKKTWHYIVVVTWLDLWTHSWFSGIILIGFQTWKIHFGSFVEVLHNLLAQDKLWKSSIKFLLGLLSRWRSCPETKISILYLAKAALLFGALNGFELVTRSVSSQSSYLMMSRDLQFMPHSGNICFTLLTNSLRRLPTWGAHLLLWFSPCSDAKLRRRLLLVSFGESFFLWALFRKSLSQVFLGFY